tara:strand:- start:41 stop:697 length:657 start_codon:yes stop_codon:yes gene_type:complete
VKIKIFFILRSFQNFLKIFLKKNINHLYLPNWSIKNMIMIDPNKIKFANSIPMKFYKSTKFIVNFDWDKDNKLITEYKHPAYISCKELFVDGVDIEKCEEYSYFQKQISKNKEWKNCKNENDIYLFLKKKIKLFESIKKIGVKKNFISNIEFMIDRNNNLVKINGGNHRFMISRILKLKKIPIEIKVIHSNNLELIKDQKFEINKINNLIQDIADRYA